MLKTRIVVIVALVVGFIGFHLVERAWYGGRPPSFAEEILFIGGLMFGVSLLVAGIFRLRLIRRVNQVSARALEILHAGNWTARLEEGSAGTDLAELSGAVNRLLEAAGTSHRELRESEHRLAVQSQALTELTARQTGISASVSDRLRLILEICARTLGVARVSLWRFEDNRATIRCDDLYELGRGRHSSGDRLEARDFPAYFSAISHDRVVAASDAHTDPRTREFSASYLAPHGIGAMLDVPLRQEDRPLGVMCIEHVGGLVADVSGHGAPSAIVMAMIRAAVHAFPGSGRDPAEMLRYLNRHFEFLWESPMFATALCALVDPRDRSVSIACAGHPPPLQLRSGRVQPFPVEATMPVLMMALPSVPEVRHVLQAGDRLVFYTDGVTERHDPHDDMYDLPRLTAALERTAQQSPNDQVLAIVNDLDAFAGEREPEDDQTLLLMAIE